MLGIDTDPDPSNGAPTETDRPNGPGGVLSKNEVVGASANRRPVNIEQRMERWGDRERGLLVGYSRTTKRESQKRNLAQRSIICRSYNKSWFCYSSSTDQIQISETQDYYSLSAAGWLNPIQMCTLSKT